MLVLCTFGLGLISGPMRPCLNHPGHSGGSHPTAMAPGVMAGYGSVAHALALHSQDDPAPGSSVPLPQGCDCLGQCHAEQSPFLATSGPVAVAAEPAPSRAPVIRRASEPDLELEYPVPLARPPPSLSA